MGVAPIHDVVVSALSHSVGANLAFLNQRRVEKVRDLALQRGVSAEFLTKANIVAALLDACEDGFVETARSAVVVINDHPGWLLSNEAASEVVLSELKSISSRVMFLAVPPRDTLRVGDFAPSVRPPPPVAAPAAQSMESEIFGGDASSNPFASFANMFNQNSATSPDAPPSAGESAPSKPNGPTIPPWFQPQQVPQPKSGQNMSAVAAFAQKLFHNQNPTTSSVGPNDASALIGRTISVVCISGSVSS